MDVDIELTDNLDFSDANITLPLGAHSNGTCVPYSGIFRGNGHIIDGLKMDNKNNKGYNNAGLFCSLKGATIKNLIIGQSCSFNGQSTGALCVTIIGSLTVRNVVNQAKVSGKDSVGGFIGSVSQIENLDITVSNSTNLGSVSGEYASLGGFVGCLRKNTKISLLFINSFNNGTISGSLQNGGFVGFVTGNTHLNITISQSKNNANINKGQVLGGFIGSINKCDNVKLEVSQSVNNGNTNGNNCGGFIGDCSESEKVYIVFKSCANEGVHKGTGDSGGFIVSIQHSTDVNISFFALS